MVTLLSRMFANVNLKYKEKAIDFIITVYKQHVTTVGEQYSEKYLNGIVKVNEKDF